MNEQEYSSEFVINQLPHDQREYLLLKDTRKIICEAADVDIAVRGRYIKPNNDGTVTHEDDVKPLHLLIFTSSKYNLTLAMKKIQQLLKNFSTGSPNIDNDQKHDTYVDISEEKITIGIDIFPAHFRMKSRILGENDEFVKYIEKETGARISLRGKGSDFGHDNDLEEHLHVHVKYNNPEMKNRTQELVLHLIETVQKDFVERYAKYYAHPKKPEIIPIRYNGHNLIPAKKQEPVDSRVRNDIDKIMVGFDYAPRNFNLKSKIYGVNCEYVEHIEKEGGALLLLQGRGCRFPEKDDIDEPPHLLVKYRKLELKEHARNLIFNLLETVHEEFVKLHGAYPIKLQKPRIIPYNPNAIKENEKSSVSPRVSSETSRRSKSPPKTSKVLATGSSLRQERSPKRLNVVPPPPPVISKLLTHRVYEPDERTSITLSSDSGKIVPSPNVPYNNFELDIQNTRCVYGNSLADSTYPFNVSRNELNPTVQSSTISEPYISQTNVVASPQSFKTPQYVKKRSKTPEPSINKSFPTSKKYCNTSYSNASNIGQGQTANASPMSTIPQDQNFHKGKTVANRCLVTIPVKRSQISTPSTSCTTDQMPSNGCKPGKAKIQFTLRTHSDRSATTNGVHDAYKFYDNLSDSEDSASVVCIDSEEEYYQPARLTSTVVRMQSPKMTRSVGIQTDNEDEILRKRKIQCICGKFTHFVTGVRSCGIQTPKVMERYSRF